MDASYQPVVGAGQVFFQGKFCGYRRTAPLSCVLIDLPSLSHSANVNGFIVEPGWKPPRPLRSLPLASCTSTLKFWVWSNLPSAGNQTVFWAMETILPEPGCTDTSEAPHLSGFAPADPSTWAWATAWAFGSSVVLMVRPPRKIFRSRSAASAP